MPAKPDAENYALSAGEVAQLVRLEIDDAEVIVEVEGCDLLITVISPQFTVLALVKK